MDSNDLAVTKALSDQSQAKRISAPISRTYRHPVLFDPVTFDKPPEPTETADSITPSLCKVGAKAETGAPAGTATDQIAEPPRLLSESPSITPAAPTSTPPPAASPNQNPTVPVKPADIISSVVQPVTVKAYDVAQKILHKVPLRLVDEALYAFDGKVFRLMTQPDMYRLIMMTCRDAVEANGSPALIRQVYDLVRAEPKIVFRPPKTPLPYVSMNNGLLDLTSGQLLPHTADLFVTARLNGSFLTHSILPGCPCFDGFLSTVTGDDSVLAQRIWEVTGYTLVPDMAAKCFFLLQGVPNSGKSLLGDFIRSCFEDRDVTSLDFSALGQQFGPSDLLGKRLSLCLDLAATPWDNKAVGMLKLLTGNDFVSADVKYQPRVHFQNTATLIFGTNHAVVTATQDSAFMQRLVVVPFRYAVPKERQNPHLLEWFAAERDSIITRAIRAYWQLRQNKYTFSGNYHLNEVIAQEQGTVTHSWEEAIPEFFFQQCNLDEEAITFANDLYQRFVATYPELADLPTFSTKFFSLLEREFPGRVKKVRKRRPGEVNPLSAFRGLRLMLSQGTLPIGGGVCHV